MPAEAERIFRVKDYVALDKSRTMVHQYSNYKTAFSGLDQDVFDEGFEARFRQIIITAENKPSDEILLRDQVSETEDLVIVTDVCADTARSCKWYIKKASNKRKTFVDKFLYSDLDSATRSPGKMVDFMEKFSYQINKYHDVLTEAGMPEGKREEIERNIEQLKQERVEQQDAISNRSDMAEERVHALNRVWEIMQILNEASDYIFENDPVAREIFSLPQPENSVQG